MCYVSKPPEGFTIQKPVFGAFSSGKKKVYFVTGEIPIVVHYNPRLKCHTHYHFTTLTTPQASNHSGRALGV
jgi:hypothetical protein